LGGPLAAGLLMTEGLAGLHGWQYLFVVLGGITVIYSFVFWASPSPKMSADMTSAAGIL